MLRLVIAMAIGFGTYLYLSGQLNGVLLKMELDGRSVHKITCEELAQLHQGRTMKNLFGGKFRILSIENPRRVALTTKGIECSGDAFMDNGTMTEVIMKAERTADGGKRYSIRGQLNND